MVYEGSNGDLGLLSVELRPAWIDSRQSEGIYFFSREEALKNLQRRVYFEDFAIEDRTKMA